jgi:hypothetical protein
MPETIRGIFLERGCNMMKDIILGAVVAAFIVGGGPTAADEPQQSRAVKKADMPPADWLFVQIGSAFTSDGKSLTVKGVSPQTLMFTDRPERMTGDVRTSQFVQNWTTGKDNFRNDPPNATISTVVDGETKLAVVELLNPRLDGDSLTYDIKTLDGTLPSSGAQISLFVDWWYGPGGYCWRGQWGHVHCRPGWGWGWTGGPGHGGQCWRGPWGHLHCRPWWG